jgi:hypothetical protein
MFRKTFEAIEKPYFFIPNFMSSGNCEAVIRYYQKYGKVKSSEDEMFYKDRVIWSRYIQSNHTVKEIFEDNKKKIKKILCELYYEKEIYPCSSQIVHWPEDLGISDHFDRDFKKYVGIVYLNDNFEEGEFYFYQNNQRRLIKPLRGALLCFRSNQLLHGTRAPLGNSRYTMPFWFSKEKKYLEPFVSSRPMPQNIEFEGCFD